jgi:integrase
MGVKVREKVKGSGVWYVYIHHQGQRKNKMVGPKHEAEQVKKELEQAIAKGTFGIRSCPTFNKLFNEFVPNRPVRAQSTRNYMRLHEKYLKKSIGPKPLDAITYEDLARIPFGKVSNTHRGNILTVVSMVLNEAKRREYIDKIPLDIRGSRSQIVGKVNGENGRKPFETPEEVLLFLKQTGSSCPKVYFFKFLTLTGCGLRLGEAVGLDWPFVDFERNLIRIRQTWLFEDKQLGPPKTEASKRDVAMPKTVATALDAWSTEAESEIVFPNKLGKRMTSSGVHQMMSKVCDELKIQRRSAKDLRATYGTLRAKQNNSLQSIQNQMGHEDIKVTMKHYTKYVPASDKEQIEELGEMILPSPKRTQAHPSLPMPTIEE